MVLELQLQRKLNNARCFACLDDGLRGRRRHRSAAGLSKNVGPDTGRTDGRIARIVEVRVVESVEHLSSELKLEPLGDLERLDKSEVEIPVARRGENISAGAVLTWRWQAKSLCQINAAGKRIDWLKQNGTGESLSGKELELGSNRRLHTSARFVIPVSGE